MCNLVILVLRDRGEKKIGRATDVYSANWFSFLRSAAERKRKLGAREILRAPVMVILDKVFNGLIVEYIVCLSLEYIRNIYQSIYDSYIYNVYARLSI